MLVKKPLDTKRNAIKGAFAKFGFRGIIAFYNVCKSIDVTLNGFELIAFWRLNKGDEKLLLSLENVLTILENE